MRRIVTAIGIGFALSMLTASPAEAQLFKKKPKITRDTPLVKGGVRQGTRAGDPTHVSRKQMVSSVKAAQKRGAATLKSANKELAASARTEQSMRGQLANARARVTSAELDFNAQPSPRTQASLATARAPLPALETSYNDALAKARTDSARVRQLENFQRQAFNSIRYAATLKPRAARAGRPNAAAAPRVAAARPVVFDGAAVVRPAAPVGAAGYVKPPPPAAVQNIKSIYALAPLASRAGAGAAAQPNYGAGPGPRPAAVSVPVQNGYIAMAAPMQF